MKNATKQMVRSLLPIIPMRDLLDFVAGRKPKPTTAESAHHEESAKLFEAIANQAENKVKFADSFGERSPGNLKILS